MAGHAIRNMGMRMDAGVRLHRGSASKQMDMPRNNVICIGHLWSVKGRGSWGARTWFDAMWCFWLHWMNTREWGEIGLVGIKGSVPS